MSELRVETLMMPAARVGPENPLPPLRSGRDIHATAQVIPGIPDDMLRNMAYGRVASILPYTMQDRYTRDRAERGFRVAVLENEILRAAFLLEYGGRMWSLLHKPTGRELLDKNPVFQPANLALRNAWFSGGVEWNIGTTGHSPFTCSPLFAAHVETAEGMPVLRMYEWERIRRVPFQIDAYLPDGSPVLYVAVRITNPHDVSVPMYWWSNIAVPETVHTRVVTPADSAYSFGYGGARLAKVPIPLLDGVDVTYPTHIQRAADFFFHVPEGTRPWITALDAQGRGLIQTSTPRLKGRKLFLWGMGEGGRRWQTFLSQPGNAYIEIQAGLARTQLEHLPMPARGIWTWLEAYGLMEADPELVHGENWDHARGHVAARLERLVGAKTLARELARALRFVDDPPNTILQQGSGWGALEARARELSGKPPFCSRGLRFVSESLGAPQAPWLTLLETGAMPDADPLDEPIGCLVAQPWRDHLERAVAHAPDNWLQWNHLGVARYHAGDQAGARQAWRRSLADTDNPWALRNLAVVDSQAGSADRALAHYRGALRHLPGYLPLLIESGRQLIALNRAADWLELLDCSPRSVRRVGRIRLLEGRAALATGDLDRVVPLFDGSLVVEDLREGERSLSELWVSYHLQRISRHEGIPIDEALRDRVRREHPVPAFLDYRMSGGS